MSNCLTVSELSRRLGIGRNAAYALAVSDGFFPAFRIGRRLLISEDALGQWLAEQTGGDRRVEHGSMAD